MTILLPVDRSKSLWNLHDIAQEDFTMAVVSPLLTQILRAVWGKIFIGLYSILARN